MAQNDDDFALVRTSLYEQSYNDLDQLRMQLPQDAVVSLAREVLVRLANMTSNPATPPGTIRALADALISADPQAAAKLIEQYHLEGTDVKKLYLDYLAPAAQRLGQYWEHDEITFTDVAIGTGRIYAIMRNLARRFPPIELPQQKSAIFASVPDESHTLGVTMAADLFRKEGWTIDLEIGAPHDALIDRITRSGHLLIGLSGAGLHSLSALTRLVLALRISLPHALIFVSGNTVAEAGESLKLLHIDGMSTDFDDTLRQMNDFWTVLQLRRA